MENYDFWSSLIYAILAIYFGAMISRSLTRSRLETKERIEKQVRDHMIINVDVEKHGEQYYLFDQKTGQFVAQGRNLEELKERCDERYKTKVIVANNDILRKFNLI